ncbi:MAG: nuclease [Acidobacteriaceae bacterium]
MRSLPPLLLPVCAMLCALAAPVRAQQLIGYVNTRDADVVGARDVLDGRAVLMGSVSVAARDHTAPISLGRGGTVRVCQTSVLHLSESREMMVAAPLLFSLDRGAIEIQTGATATDSIMTPDLRLTVRSPGPLDLRLRVAGNGDTCVDNRGAGAPMLTVSDPFGDATYELAAGQHVLFEHGSLREVVDHETSPCGCPDAQGLPLADAPIAPPAAAEHPFPVAISEGLAPVPEVPQAPPGEVHAQVSETLSYNAQPSLPPSTDAAAGAPSSAAPPPNDLVHLVGRLFRKLFRRS